MHKACLDEGVKRETCLLAGRYCLLELDEFTDETLRSIKYVMCRPTSDDQGGDQLPKT